MSKCSRYGCSRAPAHAISRITQSHSFQISSTLIKHHYWIVSDALLSTDQSAEYYRNTSLLLDGSDRSTGHHVTVGSLHFETQTVELAKHVPCDTSVQRYPDTFVGKEKRLGGQRRDRLSLLGSAIALFILHASEEHGTTGMIRELYPAPCRKASHLKEQWIPVFSQ